MLPAVARDGRRSRVWLVRAAGAMLIVIGVAAPLLLRVAWEGRAELEMADAAAERGRVDLEIVHLGRAARWRAPFFGHDEDALARLMAVAGTAKMLGDAGSQTALMAHREVRAALLATRGLGPVDPSLLDAVNHEIAGAMAEQELLFGTDLSGRGEREAHHFALLEAARVGDPRWLLFAALAIVAAALGLVIGVPTSGRARRGVVIAVVALALLFAATAWALRPG